MSALPAHRTFRNCAIARLTGATLHEWSGKAGAIVQKCETGFVLVSLLRGKQRWLKRAS